MIICLLLIAAETHWMELGSYRVSSRSETFTVLQVDKAGSKQINRPGRLLTASGTGVLFTRDEHTFFYPFATGGEYVLPDPGGLVLKTPLANIFLPAFFEVEGLVLFYEGAWLRIAAPAWSELTPPKTALGSRVGLNLLVPNAIQVGSTLSIYQGKTGQLILFNLARAQRTEKQLSKRLVPVKAADNLLWLNAPKKGRLALSHVDNPSFIHHISIPDLSRHSPAWSVNDGCWLFSFADGFSDALNSWDSGKVPVQAHFIRVAENRLVKRSFALSPLPVRFQMETSASGSPRLGIDPLFQVLPVQADNRLIVLTRTAYFVLDPTRGAGRHNPLTPLRSVPVAVVLSETGLKLLLADGQSLSLKE